MNTADDTRRKEEFNEVEWSVDHNPRVSCFRHTVSVCNLMLERDSLIFQVNYSEVSLCIL